MLSNMRVLDSKCSPGGQRRLADLQHARAARSQRSEGSSGGSIALALIQVKRWLRSGDHGERLWALWSSRKDSPRAKPSRRSAGVRQHWSVGQLDFAAVRRKTPPQSLARELEPFNPDGRRRAS